jgi:hypothetical protein
MKERRLTKLADFLENLPVERPKGKFDMDSWGEHKGKHPPSEKNYCGFSACALGWATTIPSFKRAGLQAEWTRYSRPSETLDWGLTVVFEGKDGTDAGIKFFDINYVSARILFSGQLKTRKSVVRAIRYLVKHGEDKLEEKYGKWE